MLIGTNSYSQLIPNGDFEGPPFDWKGTGGGNASLSSSEDLTLSDNSEVTLTAFAGTFYGEVINTSSIAGMWQKTPFTGRPASLRFAYTYVPKGDGDAGGVIVYFTKYNTSTSQVDTILGDTAIFEAEQYPWQEYTLDLEDKYQNSDSPDSMYFLFTASLFSSFNQGTLLAVDNIRFSNHSAAVNKNTKPATTFVSPNPATSEINVKVDAKQIGTSYIVYNQYGKKVKTGVLRNMSNTIDVSNLSKGVYLFNLGDSTNQAIKVLIQ